MSHDSADAAAAVAAAAAAAATPSAQPPPPLPLQPTQSHKLFDDCERNGPRPRVPGQETRTTTAMTEGAGTMPKVGAAADALTPSDAPPTAAARLVAGPAQSYHHPQSAQHPQSVAAAMLPNSSTVNATAAVNFAHLRDPHQSLIQLLDESTGAELFKSFVEEHGGIHSARLNFYFACEGLKQQTDDAKIRQMVAAIYKFLQKSDLTLDKELRARIKAGLKQTDCAMDAHIFNAMQADVVAEICRTTFAEFHKDQRHIDHVNALAMGTATMPPPARHPQHQQQQQLPPAAQTALPPSAASAQSPWMSSPIAPPGTMLLSQTHHHSIGNERTLMTLHEDSELSSCEPTQATATSASGSWMPLTSSALRATEGPRLGVRPNGAHGYVGQFSSAYNPVSLQNSECMSVSSGGYGKSDPDLGRQISRTAAREGRTDHHRRTPEQHNHSSIGTNTLLHSGLSTSATSVPGTGHGKHIINQNHHHLPHHPHNMPTNIGSGGTGGGLRILPKTGMLTEDDFKMRLLPKLEAIKHQQDNNIETNARLSRGVFVNADRYSTLHAFPADDDNDQSILDKHVSRVWDKSPLLSPGTKSPFPATSAAAAAASSVGGSGDMFGGADAFGVSAMRHSARSMPGKTSGATGATAGTSSTSASSGASAMQSMFGIDGGGVQQMKQRIDQVANSRTATTTRGLGGTEVACSKTLEEARRRLEDVSRIPPTARQHVAHYSQEAPLPPPPAQVNARTHESRVALITLPNEPLRYRYKLPGLQPTLRQFKEILPKKGNFRFFFKTTCDDPDNPVIQVEIDNDADLLPLLDGKVDCKVKEYE